MNTERPRQRRGGVYLESTEAEQLGVLPGEERRVREVMDRRLVVIAASSSLAAAAELMRQRRVTSLIVETEAEPIGLLTDRDVDAVRRAEVPAGIAAGQRGQLRAECGLVQCVHHQAQPVVVAEPGQQRRQAIDDYRCAAD